MAGSFDLNAVMDVVLWWTNSSGDNLTRQALPDSLLPFLPIAMEGEPMALSIMEMLCLLTEIIMMGFNSDLDHFDTISEWLEILGKFWTNHSVKLTRKIRARLHGSPPHVNVTFMVYTGNNPRVTVPNTAARFAEMVRDDSIEFTLAPNTAPRNEP